MPAATELPAGGRGQKSLPMRIVVEAANPRASALHLVRVDQVEARHRVTLNRPESIGKFPVQAGLMCLRRTAT
jgi:hypothetical protein